MASITVRNIDEDTKRKLKTIAEKSGRSVESQVRMILDRAAEHGGIEYFSLNPRRASALSVGSGRTHSAKTEPISLAERIHAIMTDMDAFSDDLVLPARDEYTREIAF